MSGSLVREAEEVLGSSTNWAKHFHKQFHHELSSARLTKKTLLGSHICMIFHWIKQQRGKKVPTPITISIPPPIVPRKEGNAIPPAPPAKQMEVVAPATKAPRTKLVPGPANSTPTKVKAAAPGG
ncbi:unnamed protein product [Calypogeia fissa]